MVGATKKNECKAMTESQKFIWENNILKINEEMLKTQRY